MLRIGPRPDGALAGKLAYVKLLALLVVLLIALLQIAPYLSGAGRPRRARIPVKTDQGERLPTYAAAPAGPLLSRDERAKLQHTPDGGPSIDPAALRLVVKKVRETPRERLRSLASFSLASSDVDVSPDAYRGRVGRFVGALERLEPSAAAPGLYEGQIIDKNLRVVSFYLTDKPTGFAPGRDTVEIDGVFVGHITYETRAGGRCRTPVLVARGLLPAPAEAAAPPPRAAAPASAAPAAPAQAPRKPFLDSVERMAISEEKDQTMRPLKAPLMLLFRKVADTPAETLEAYVDPSVTYDDFATRPLAQRGKVVRFIGTLQRVARSHMDVSEAGLDAIYEGQIRDKNWDLYSFYVTDKPVGFRVMQDVVVLVGVYYTNIVYETRGGGLKATPLIIGRRLTLYQPPRRVEAPGWTDEALDRLAAHPALAGALAALLLALLALLALWSARRRAARGLRGRAIARQLEQLEKELDE